MQQHLRPLRTKPHSNCDDKVLGRAVRKSAHSMSAGCSQKACTLGHAQGQTSALPCGNSSMQWQHALAACGYCALMKPLQCNCCCAVLVQSRHALMAWLLQFQIYLVDQLLQNTGPSHHGGKIAREAVNVNRRMPCCRQKLSVLATSARPVRSPSPFPRLGRSQHHTCL